MMRHMSIINARKIKSKINKNVHLLFVILASGTLFLGTSCGPEDDKSQKERGEHAMERRQLQNELEAKELARKNLEDAFTKLKDDLASEKKKQSELTTQCEALRQQGAPVPMTEHALKQQLQPVQTDCASNLKQRNVLRNPTWQELKDFLRDDLTNEKSYDRANYNCQGFTLELRDHARDLGWRSAFISVSYEGKDIGHAFNAFETSDEGLIYIEPQKDSVRYVELGRPEGEIPVQAVKNEFFACQNPEDLQSENIVKARYAGSLFEYSYFENYEQRMTCWWRGFEAYEKAKLQHNGAVDRFNEAIQAFNDGVQTRAESERLKRESALLNDKLVSLKKWKANIDLFAEDIGRLIKDGSYLMPPTVKSNIEKIERYWN